MTVLLIVFVSVAAYLCIGWLLAKRDLPRAWARARQYWTFDDGYARRSVVEQTAVMVTLWPVVRPARAIGRVVDAADPKVRERELREREAEIRRMERELGIGRAS